jgi:3-oxosteroid 1-dehydrogenase
VIGDLKTHAEIKTDVHARALDADGGVNGLDAVGNDMANTMGGNCPGAGITLRPALTFGYAAARHSGQVILELSLPRSAGQVD